MARDGRYDILFEPLAIGPVVAKNRFYQTPHASGMGYTMPRSLAAMRGIKAEGGWGVVCTEYCSIHPSADDSPYAFATLWDEQDVKAQALMVESVKRHGALAAVELWHGGHHCNNRMTRMAPLSPSGLPTYYAQPLATRAMDGADIRAFRGWQVAAAKRARQAGFDIVYVYAGHEYLPFQFLSRRLNHRGDEYGGSLENRVRLLREMIEETKEAVGESCGVAVRLAVDELMGEAGLTSDGEGREVVEMLAELPDLWDVNVSFVQNDSLSARFSEEAFQEPYVAFVKSVTSKPVVGVGRFTSPDAMVSQLRRGVLDFIGAARPSIADPFLPKKIEEGRLDEIRECIGCNICRASNNEGVPLRCTQNPTMGEEWRRGWHPEIIAAKASEARVLVVGAGPAGLECAASLGRRCYAVTLAEADGELGGRVRRESAGLPGLASWIRVRDHRQQLMQQQANVEVYLHSRLDAEAVLELGADHVVLATGARWRRDGVGIANTLPIAGCDGPNVLTPDDILVDGVGTEGGGALSDPVVIFDDDHYYMGGCLAEKLRRAGHAVTLVTPESLASSWTVMTNEQDRVHARLLDLGVEIVLLHNLRTVGPGEVRLASVYGDRALRLACGSLVLVTARQPRDELLFDLKARRDDWLAAGIKSVTPIGDCEVPGAIAHAVYAGHRFARELDSPDGGLVPFRRERVEL